MAGEDEDGGEREALLGMVESDGWRRFTAYVGNEWGAEASIRKIDDTLGKAQPGDDMTAIVLQIRASARQIQNLLRWPTERIGQLGAKKSSRPFDGLRRIVR